jgi:RHS repeat-associated protein
MNCDPAKNGFTFTESYVLGLSGEQLTMFDGSGNWQRTNVYVAGRLLGTYDTQGLHFHLNDPLGTRRMQLSGNLATLGRPETHYQSFPFGDQLITTTEPNAPSTANDATPLHFTGKERDSESGNDYFRARYYGSSRGKMLSPDPSQLYFADQGNPQSLNLYAYVQNNPLRYIDRNGLKCFQVDSAGNLTGTSNAGDCATDANGNPTNNDIYVDDEKSKNPLLNDNGD